MSMIVAFNTFIEDKSLANAQALYQYRDYASAKAVYPEALAEALAMVAPSIEDDRRSYLADMEETGGHAVISDGGQRHFDRINRA